MKEEYVIDYWYIVLSYLFLVTPPPSRKKRKRRNGEGDLDNCPISGQLHLANTRRLDHIFDHY